MTSIKNKLDALKQPRKIFLSTKKMKDIFGLDFESNIVIFPKGKWNLFFFEENGALYQMYLQPSSVTFDDIIEEYEVRNPLEDTHFYYEIDDDLFYLLKEYRAYHQKQLNALEIIFSHKKFRIKGLF